MIAEDRWYVIADAREVRGRRPTKLRRFGEDLAVWRGADGQVRAIADRCPHRGASLSLGRVEGDDLACPFHGFRFGGDGACTHIPAHGEGGTIPKAMRGPAEVVREAKGWIWLWRGPRRERYPELPWFPQIGDDWPYHTFGDTWPVHVTRAVENQLDAMHLSFVHKGTLAFLTKPQVQIETRVDGDRIRFWDRNATGEDEGGPEPERLYLEFRAPNLWINHLGRFIILAAFVPVDDACSITYLRTYQGLVKLPGVGHLLCWINSQLNRVVLGQDRRVVVSQRPIASALEMDEVLVPGDRPIIEYRRLCKAERDRLAARADDGR